MKTRIRDKLVHLVLRLEAVDALLAAAGASSDREAFRRLGQERAELEPVVERFAAFEQAEASLAAAMALRGDPEMAELVEEEISSLQKQLPAIEHELQCLLLPRDPNDERNVILEIRAGTGGEESALFAASLFRMYGRYAERRRWQMEVISANESDLGGYKEIIARIVGNSGSAGQGAYSQLKFESGGHRVQRVPETETQGRIHTSACTVAVMAEADELAEVEILPADLRVDTFRASGAGGQHINKTDSAVRLTHLPTGIVVECQDGRSQHQNKAQALRVLATRINDVRQRAAQAREAAERKSLVGSGDRSERIRTYNFPQGRVTDHRINLTLYKIDAIMDGDLSELITALTTEHQASALAALAGESERA